MTVQGRLCKIIVGIKICNLCDGFGVDIFWKLYRDSTKEKMKFSVVKMNILVVHSWNPFKSSKMYVKVLNQSKKVELNGNTKFRFCDYIISQQQHERFCLCERVDLFDLTGVFEKR